MKHYAKTMLSLDLTVGVRKGTLLDHLFVSDATFVVIVGNNVHNPEDGSPHNLSLTDPELGPYSSRDKPLREEVGMSNVPLFANGKGLGPKGLSNVFVLVNCHRSRFCPDVWQKRRSKAK